VQLGIRALGTPQPDPRRNALERQDRLPPQTVFYMVPARGLLITTDLKARLRSLHQAGNRFCIRMRPPGAS
jgi:hypothetical protein